MSCLLSQILRLWQIVQCKLNVWSPASDVVLQLQTISRGKPAKEWYHYQRITDVKQTFEGREQRLAHNKTTVQIISRLDLCVLSLRKLLSGARGTLCRLTAPETILAGKKFFAECPVKAK